MQFRNGKRMLILLTAIWIIWALAEYYYPYNTNSVSTHLFRASGKIGFFIIFCSLIILQGKALFHKSKANGRFNIPATGICLILLLLTIFSSFTNRVIERIDWRLFYNERMVIIRQIKKGLITATGDFGECRLPDRFSRVSANNIIRIHGTQNDSLTIIFYMHTQGFADYVVSSQFIYTNDAGERKYMNTKIKRNPKENWKLNDEWYRLNTSE